MPIESPTRTSPLRGHRASPGEDQIFEIVVCAAIGEATRQYDTVLAALDAVTGKVGNRGEPEGASMFYTQFAV